MADRPPPLPPNGDKYMLNGEEVIPRRLVDSMVQQERRRWFDRYLNHVRATIPSAEPSRQQDASVKDGHAAPRVVGNGEASGSGALTASSAETSRDTVPKTKEASGAGIAATAARQLAAPLQKGNAPAPTNNRLPGLQNANGSNLDRLTGLGGNGNVRANAPFPPAAANMSSQPSHSTIRTPASPLVNSNNLWNHQQMTEVAWMLDTLGKKFPGRTPAQVEDMVRSMINVRHPPKPASFADTQELQAYSLNKYLARQLGTSGIAKTPAQPTNITINLPEDLSRYANTDSLAVNVPVQSASGQNVTMSLKFRAAQQPMPRQQPPRPNNIPQQNTMPPAPQSKARPPRPPTARSGVRPSVSTGKPPPTHQAAPLHPSGPPNSPPPNYWETGKSGADSFAPPPGYNVYKDSQGRLPGGWERAEDRLGRTYYIDHCGFETTWIRPGGQPDSDSDSDDDSSSDSDDGSCDCGC